jgi:hypothetical protein
VALTLTVAAALVALAFLTSGSSDPDVLVSGGYAWSEIAMTILGAGAGGIAVLIGGRGRASGAGAVALFAAFTGFAALSIVWSVQPDWSWYGANQLFAYLAVFAGAAAMARVFPERWPVVVGGIAMGMVALAAYSLLAKVFPATLASANTYGRLLAPFSYWNAIGVAAGLGVPACLWAGARRGRGLVMRALTVPALSLLISVVILSYSRSAVLAAAVGAAIWIACAPLRLRSALILGLGGAGAVPIVVWALSHHSISGDSVARAAQDAAGHSFGLVLIVVLLVATAGGVTAALGMDRVTLSDGRRRRIGTALIGLIALIPVAVVAALATSSRGLTGEISHVWTTLTSSKGTGDTSARLTQFGSSRPTYWHQGLQVGSHNLLKGVGELGYGIARLRYTTEPFKVDQAHSFVIQTFADLGLVGAAIMIALLVAWAISGARALAPRVPWSGLSPERTAERQGLLVLAAVAIPFGIQSALDWTWYFAGVTVPALIAAGWLAGRGSLTAPIGRRPGGMALRERPGAGALATAVAAAALIGAWAMWAPLHSAQSYASAEQSNANGAAFAGARTAASSDPLSIKPLELLAQLDEGIHAETAAQAELIKATQVQPRNPESWLQLGAFYFQRGAYAKSINAMARVADLDHTRYDAFTLPSFSFSQRAQAVLQAARVTARAAARAHRGSHRG